MEYPPHSTHLQNSRIYDVLLKEGLILCHYTTPLVLQWRISPDYYAQWKVESRSKWASGNRDECNQMSIRHYYKLNVLKRLRLKGISANTLRYSCAPEIALNFQCKAAQSIHFWVNGRQKPLSNFSQPALSMQHFIHAYNFSSKWSILPHISYSNHSLHKEEIFQ